MNQSDDLNPIEYEVRSQWYGGLICTSNDIKMLRFQLEMEQHYRDEQDKHDLMIHCMQAQTNALKSRIPFIPILIALYLLLK